MDIILEQSLEIEGYSGLVIEKDVRDFVEYVLIKEFDSNKPVYLSILFTGNNEIQVINKEFRQKDQPTDVISFAYHESEDFDVGPYDTLGDIIISLETVESHAKEYEHSFRRELFYVITHGILHLLGYDHIEEADKIEMRKKEEEILTEFGYVRF
ncbi:rRNA maturation RNase YbeY [Fusobacterium sp. PH5-44]|uniref:rRNA maturation RNase YbeY n=1 Tax=unclassified Fusobacterium TaxID=2648384 RepID=UPI003D1E48FE